MNSRTNPRLGVLSIAVTTLAFSTMEIAGKSISGQFNPFQLTLIRFAIGGLFLLPFALLEMRRRELRLTWSDIGFFFLTGAVGIGVSMSFFQLAILHADAAVVAVIFSTNPVFTIALAVLFFGEKFTGARLVALGLSLGGILVIFNPLAITNKLAGTGSLSGMLLALAAAVCFSAYTIIGKARLQRYGGLILNSFSFMAGCLILLIGLPVFGIMPLGGITADNALTLIYLGIFVTGIGYLCYFSAMKHLSVVTATAVFFIKPALAPLLAWLILGEPIGWRMLGGILLVVAGAAVLFRGERRRLAAQVGR
jgi:drug/metabolite transporter (DMT)-like permease